MSSLESALERIRHSSFLSQFDHKMRRYLFFTLIFQSRQITSIPKSTTKYKKVKNIIWGQEEPENMGAWTYMAMNMRHIDLKCVSRAASAAPAAGAKEIHLRRLNRLYNNLFEYAAVAVK